jgi:chromosome segregation ATPase
MAKAVFKAGAAVEPDIGDSPALLELLGAKSEITAIKSRAFNELRRWSRSMIGIMLLSDDLAECAGLDEVIVNLRRESHRLTEERDALNASVAEIKATEEALRVRVAGLTGQVERLNGRVQQLDERVEELDQEKAQLEATIAAHRALEIDIAATTQRRDALRAEEARLSDTVRSYQEMEGRLLEKQKALEDVQIKLDRIKQSL